MNQDERKALNDAYLHAVDSVLVLAKLAEDSDCEDDAHRRLRAVRALINDLLDASGVGENNV